MKTTVWYPLAVLYDGRELRYEGPELDVDAKASFSQEVLQHFVQRHDMPSAHYITEFKHGGRLVVYQVVPAGQFLVQVEPSRLANALEGSYARH